MAGQWKIEDHRTAGGQSRFRQFIDGLTREERADAVALVRLLENQGVRLRKPHSAPLGDGLFELRSRRGVRIFYVFRPGGKIVLLDGMMKKRDDIPHLVMTRLRKLQKEVN